MILLLIFGCIDDNNTLPTIDKYHIEANKFDKVLTIPELNISPEKLTVETNKIIHCADSALNKLTLLKDEEINFNSIIVELENIYYPTILLSNKLELIVNTNPNKSLRIISEILAEKLNEWSIKSGYREDIYTVIKKLEKKNPKLIGEDKKLFIDYLISYQRSGFELSNEIRNKVILLSLELSQLTTQFYRNIREYDSKIYLSKSDLVDLDVGVLDKFPLDKNGNYVINPTLYFQTSLIMENSSNEEVREKVSLASNSVAKNSNIALLNSIIIKRSKIAKLLSYSSWAEYSIESKMAKTPDKVKSFLMDLSSKLDLKFTNEIEILREMKVAETSDENAKINSWDVNYYENKLINQQFNINQEELRKYFSYDRVLMGMFEVFEDIFGLSITEIQPPFKWDESVELFLVCDAESQNPLGLFYTDMFPRDGKYKHFAQFDLISGRRLPNGQFQCPVAALVCNFPPKVQNSPSLLYFEDVETLFHEFGHVMHFILTRAKYPSNSGTNVPGDFVEAPSQLLENWVFDKEILDRFAQHYLDDTKTIPQDILDNLVRMKSATIGTDYRSQISYALLDIALHSEISEENHSNINELANNIISKYYLALPEGSAFIASFDHLIDYDAGYYGYIWSEVISDDMASIFQNSPKGYLDKEVGKKLRTEIYEVGDSRDINKSIEEFLGRKWDSKSFIEGFILSD